MAINSTNSEQKHLSFAGEIDPKYIKGYKSEDDVSFLLGQSMPVFGPSGNLLGYGCEFEVCHAPTFVKYLNYPKNYPDPEMYLLLRTDNMIPETWLEKLTKGQRYFLVPMEETHMDLSDGRSLIPSGKKVTEASIVPVLDDFSPSKYDKVWTKQLILDEVYH